MRRNRRMAPISSLVSSHLFLLDLSSSVKSSEISLRLLFLSFCHSCALHIKRDGREWVSGSGVCFVPFFFSREQASGGVWTAFNRSGRYQRIMVKTLYIVLVCSFGLLLVSM